MQRALFVTGLLMGTLMLTPLLLFAQTNSSLDSLDPGTKELLGPFDEFTENLQGINREARETNTKIGSGIEAIRVTFRDITDAFGSIIIWTGNALQAADSWLQANTGISIAELLRGVGNFFIGLLRGIIAGIQWLLSFVK